MFENNPDLKKSAQFKEQARLSIDSASGSYLPEISLQGTYGYRQRDTGLPPLSGDEWLAGVFLEWSLFEGGITRAQVGKARARFREVEWNDKAVRDQVQVDLQPGCRGHPHGTRLHPVLEKTGRSAGRGIQGDQWNSINGAKRPTSRC